jgi:glucan phosphoethanolaminetransferase (alkaline phosphatase superfamily)
MNRFIQVWKTPKLAKKLIGLFIILTLLLTLALGMMELFYYKWSSRFFDNALILLHLHFSIFAKFMYIFLFLFISCFLSMSFLRTSTPAFPVLVSGHDYWNWLKFNFYFIYMNMNVISYFRRNEDRREVIRYLCLW